MYTGGTKTSKHSKQPWLPLASLLDYHKLSQSNSHKAKIRKLNKTAQQDSYRPTQKGPVENIPLMLLWCSRAALRRFLVQASLTKSHVLPIFGMKFCIRSINCHTESPHVDYQWKWLARKDCFGLIIILQLLMGMQVISRADAKHNGIEDAWIEIWAQSNIIIGWDIRWRWCRCRSVQKVTLGHNASATQCRSQHNIVNQT